MTLGHRKALLVALGLSLAGAVSAQRARPDDRAERSTGVAPPDLGGQRRRPHHVHQERGIRSLLDQRRVRAVLALGFGGGRPERSPLPRRGGGPRRRQLQRHGAKRTLEHVAHPPVGAGRGTVPALVAALSLRASRAWLGARHGDDRRRVVPLELRPDDRLRRLLPRRQRRRLRSVSVRSAPPGSASGCSPTADTTGSPPRISSSPRRSAPPIRARPARSTSARSPPAAASSGSRWP